MVLGVIDHFVSITSGQACSCVWMDSSVSVPIWVIMSERITYLSGQYLKGNGTIRFKTPKPSSFFPLSLITHTANSRHFPLIFTIKLPSSLHLQNQGMSECRVFFSIDLFFYFATHFTFRVLILTSRIITHWVWIVVVDWVDWIKHVIRMNFLVCTFLCSLIHKLCTRHVQ